MDSQGSIFVIKWTDWTKNTQKTKDILSVDVDVVGSRPIRLPMIGQTISLPICFSIGILGKVRIRFTSRYILFIFPYYYTLTRRERQVMVVLCSRSTSYFVCNNDTLEYFL